MTPPTAASERDPQVDVEAAGCVVVRTGEQGVEVLLVHRPTTAVRAADWSWPKGKLEPGEHAAVAAVRETAEESGVRVHLGNPLPEQRYEVAGGLRKRVRYWLARPAAPADPAVVEAADPDEIDDSAWVSPARARDLLSYPADVELLDVALPGDALPRPTWPLAVVRHARAVKRTDWDGSEDERPLLDRGHAQSRELAPLLACFDLHHLVTSPWARCVQTLLPAAELLDLPLTEEDAITEDGHDLDPAGARKLVGELLAEGSGVVLCSHGPVLPTLQSVVGEHAGDPVLRERIEERLGKGDVVIAHLVQRGSTARVVAVERHGV
ncbi:NUDIX domain-containing protein [Kineococcus sp. GCM10028916]|uniref:NUDIX hydrolase n=1 Tax=Kineococcus sp. GCM10028916 TaxID=3273394 RepID=UPI00362E1563